MTLDITVVELAPHDQPPEVPPTARERIGVYLSIGGGDAAWKRCDHKVAARARELGCPFVMRTGFIGGGLLRESGYFVDFYAEKPMSDPYRTYTIN